MGDDQLGSPTPNAEFDVRALANHALGGANMFAGMLGGTPAADVAEGATAAELAAGFHASGQQLIAAAEAEGALGQMVKLGPMELPGAAAVSLMAADHIVHAWDLSRATGIEAPVSDELAQFALDSWKQMLAPQMRDGKQFAAETSLQPEPPSWIRLLRSPDDRSNAGPPATGREIPCRPGSWVRTSPPGPGGSWLVWRHLSAGCIPAVALASVPRTPF